MNIIIWLAVGGIIGWLASIFMKTDGQQGIILNIVVGIIGSFVGGFLVHQGLLKLPYNFDVIPYGNQIVVSTIGALLVIIIARILGR